MGLLDKLATTLMIIFSWIPDSQVTQDERAHRSDSGELHNFQQVFGSLPAEIVRNHWVISPNGLSLYISGLPLTSSLSHNGEGSSGPWARNFIWVSYVREGPQAMKPSSDAFPRWLAERWIGSRALENQISNPMGCQHCRWWLNLLCYLNLKN